MILCLLELRFKGCLATVAVTAGTPLILLCKLLKIGDGKWRHGNNEYTEAGVCHAASQFNVGGVNYKIIIIIITIIKIFHSFGLW